MSEAVDETKEEEEFFAWLVDPTGGTYREYKKLDEFIYVAIKPLLYHWTMIVGIIGDKMGYEDRWCYANQELAEKAIREWDGVGDPEGWHRHPKSGRRRENGDPSKEYICF